MADDGVHGRELWVIRSQQIVKGDSNRDGVFNQLDIVEVLQSAKYLTDEPAAFEQGDWNGDGFFDQLDIVAALQAGTYHPTDGNG